MEYPYLLLSDTHYHAFHQFATVDADGVNSRLKSILGETRRAVETLKKAGGKFMVHGGDAFHVRGELAPTVLNPVANCYKWIHEQGVQIAMLAGNHDLEGRESTELGNASSVLAHVAPHSTVVTDPRGLMVGNSLIMIPYDHNLNRLRETLGLWRDGTPDHDTMDVVIHAPVNGVIKGLPDSGLSPEELADFGFRRVFAGHFHDHKELIEGKVYSIGATTHQTWGDVSSKAGFCLVYEDHVKWFSSHAPKFVDISEMDDPDEIALACDGNYVKARIKVVEESKVAELRATLEGFGAAGIVIHAERDLSATTRTAASVSAGSSIEVSIGDFVKSKAYPHEAAVLALCSDILSRAEAV